jgi:hypothetical protein
MTDLDHLTRGVTYLATTIGGSFQGEYLGMETPHGDWAMLLRGPRGIEAVALDSVTSISHAA